jgi:hypothetical protein
MKIKFQSMTIHKYFPILGEVTQEVMEVRFVVELQ